MGADIDGDGLTYDRNDDGSNSGVESNSEGEQEDE